MNLTLIGSSSTHLVLGEQKSSALKFYPNSFSLPFFLLKVWYQENNKLTCINLSIGLKYDIICQHIPYPI